MKNITIRSQLIGLTLMIIVALGGLGAYAIYQLGSANRKLEDMGTNTVPSLEVIGDLYYRDRGFY